MRIFIFLTLKIPVSGTTLIKMKIKKQIWLIKVQRRFVFCIFGFSKAKLSTCFANLRIEVLLVACYHEFAGSKGGG